MAHPSNKDTKGLPTGSLVVVGILFYALASYWPELTGGTLNAADHLYLGFL